MQNAAINLDPLKEGSKAAPGTPKVTNWFSGVRNVLFRPRWGRKFLEVAADEGRGRLRAPASSRFGLGERRSPDGGANRCRSPLRTSGPAFRRRAACLLAGGETTVTIRQRVRGRNQKWRSPPSLELADDRGIDLICGDRRHRTAYRTVGGWRSAAIWVWLRRHRLHPKESLDANDSYLLLIPELPAHRPHAHHQCHGVWPSCWL